MTIVPYYELLQKLEKLSYIDKGRRRIDIDDVVDLLDEWEEEIND